MKTIPFFVLLGLLVSCGPGTPTEETTAEAVAPEVVGEVVTYQTDTTKMIGYLAYDKNSTVKKPGILVVHEWWGHNDYARERAKMLAELGYVALAVDMYGDGKQADHPADAGKFAMSVMGNFPTAKARFLAALEELKNNPHVNPDEIGAIGYCFGGGVVLAMADDGVDLDGVVSFHGSLGLPVMPEAGKIKARVLVLNGADDPFVTQEQITAYTTAMDSAKADYQLINYPGAVHAFTDKGATAKGEKFNLPLAYNEAADKQSWEEMKKFFLKTFPQQ
ncbi:MAG: dienelactone hydrolase [Bacteroidetes bacterium]|nr:MAG: dienelactone hydrolase [Bacteroidota bacterium]PTM14893.1 MAG: dienelactone hydrolase [Bacteroidota bacterium]